MAISLDFGLFKQAFLGLDLGLGGQLIAAGMILLASIIITRNTRNIRLLLLPIGLGFTRIGLNIEPIILFSFGFVWVYTLIGTHFIGGILSGKKSAPTPKIQVVHDKGTKITNIENINNPKPLIQPGTFRRGEPPIERQN